MTRLKDFFNTQKTLNDTMTYRFIGLAADALETAFETDETLAERYAAVLKESPEKEVGLYAVSPLPDSEIRIASAGKRNAFSVVFVAKAFKAAVRLAYDAEQMDVDRAETEFNGELEEALLWAKTVKTLLDDLLMERMRAAEEEK